MKTIGSQWAALSSNKKKPYQEKADKAKAAFDKKNEKYKKSSHYAKHQEALKEWKASESKKPFKKDPNRPKRGLSAYLIFVNKKRPELTNRGLGLTEITTEAGKMWAKLSDGQKAPYEKKAAKSKAEAEKAMEKYMKT